jgi:hypothetical protein
MITAAPQYVLRYHGRAYVRETPTYRAPYINSGYRQWSWTPELDGAEIFQSPGFAVAFARRFGLNRLGLEVIEV